ncbi:hypothetical protein U1Q18_003407 [Sarracenia purpurea var. burkii]
MPNLRNTRAGGGCASPPPEHRYFLDYVALDFEEEDLDNGGGCASPPPNQVLVVKGDELNLTSQVSGVASGMVISEENG